MKMVCFSELSEQNKKNPEETPKKRKVEPLWTWREHGGVQGSNEIGQLLFYLTAAQLQSIQRLDRGQDDEEMEVEQEPVELLGIFMEGG